MMQVTIEKAKPEEANELTQVATASKKYWGYPDEWIDLWQDDLTITPEKIRARDFYVGRIGQAFVFVYSISLFTGTTYELEDCWMAPAYIGQGYGRTLFAHLLATLKSRGCTRLQIVSDPNAVGFYRKMGAVPAGELPSKPAGRKLPVLMLEIE